MTLDNILGKPQYIEGIGLIYPVKIKDYDQFLDYVHVLYPSKAHFNELNYPLLDLVLHGLGEQNAIPIFEKLFSLVFKKEVSFLSDGGRYGFLIDENHAITNINYDKVREIIMKQNIVHEQKVYKDPLVQKWAMKAMEARAKNAIKMSLEDMLTTVSVFKGVSYDVLAEQTYYQLYSDFQRISKIKSYDSTILFKCAGAKDISLEYFAEDLELYKSPYEDLFKSKDKLNKLNSSINT